MMKRRKTIWIAAYILMASILYPNLRHQTLLVAAKEVQPLAMDLPWSKSIEKDFSALETVYVTNNTPLLALPMPSAKVLEILSLRHRLLVLERGEDFVKVIDEQGHLGYVVPSVLGHDVTMIFDRVDVTMYAKGDIEIKDRNNSEGNVVGTRSQNDELHVVGSSPFDYQQVEIDGQLYYVHKDDMVDTPIRLIDVLKSQPVSYSYGGGVLSPSSGVAYGPSGKETYYNLNMSGVVSIMRGMGYDEANYPYWVRSDGAKMLGPYIMVAADYSVHPRGSLMEISLGTAIVCDTGGFVHNGSGTKVDVAVNW